MNLNEWEVKIELVSHKLNGTFTITKILLKMVE